MGINIEDSGGNPLYTVDEQADRIATIRRAAEDYGVPLFVNARTDVLLLSVGEEAGRLDEVTERARPTPPPGQMASSCPACSTSTR